MKEILVQGDISDDLLRLGIEAELTYGDKFSYKGYKVYEVSDEAFIVLSEDAKLSLGKAAWNRGGWRWTSGSNMEEPTEYVVVNDNHLKGWINEEHYKPYTYSKLTTYLEEVVGCTAFKNVCAVATDLAKYNHMTMANLFRIYQEG
jgi:hypothetical protein